MPSPTHDPTEALAAHLMKSGFVRSLDVAKSEADIILAALSAAGWHLTRAGDEAVLERTRRYVQNNLDAWRPSHPPSSQADLIEAAYADIYQKVLNVMDTGHPLREASEPEGDR